MSAIKDPRLGRAGGGASNENECLNELSDGDRKI